MSGIRMTRSLVVIASLLSWIFVGTSISHEANAADAVPFVPTPRSEALYAVPDEPERYDVPVDVPSGSGTMYVEIFRPLKGGVPAANTPVVLVVTPYLANPEVWDLYDPRYRGYYAAYRNLFVPHGYAVALAHSYGTGNSIGCLDLYGPDETAATAALVRWLGEQAWSNGRVGMIGASYDGGIAPAVATRGTAARPYLHAIVTEDPITSWYDLFAGDGVAFPGSAAAHIGAYTAVDAAPPSSPSVGGVSPEVLPTMLGACRAENAATMATFEPNANYSSWFRARSSRPNAEQVTVPMLMIRGFHDFQVTGPGPLGFFDRLPDTTPHKLVFGQWGHAMSHETRADKDSMIRAWFDRYLLGLATDVESWPNAQVQDSNGNWRAETTWPPADAQLGQLALGPVGDSGVGQLGSTAPSGSTRYAEDTDQRVFSTGKLDGPLHLTGQPILDLWVELDQEDAHIVAELRAFDADGRPLAVVAPEGAESPPWFPMLAWRSMQHLDSIKGGEFTQQQGKPALKNTPFRAPIRFYQSVDVVVPAGGRIDIVLGISQPPRVPPVDPSYPSGAHTNITIHHSCPLASALRFQLPSKHSEPLAIPGSLVDPTQPAAYKSVDGGGLAKQPVCGVKPIDPRSVAAG